MEDKLKLSSLGHTWLLDLDGTILKHNGYKIDGTDSFLDGAEEFLKGLPEKDMIVFITSRTEDYRQITENFLNSHGIRYEHIIFGAPYGERILVNDNKPTGLETCICLCRERDTWNEIKTEIDDTL